MSLKQKNRSSYYENCFLYSSINTNPVNDLSPRSQSFSFVDRNSNRFQPNSYSLTATNLKDCLASTVNQKKSNSFGFNQNNTENGKDFNKTVLTNQLGANNDLSSFAHIQKSKTFSQFLSQNKQSTGKKFPHLDAKNSSCNGVVSAQDEFYMQFNSLDANKSDSGSHIYVAKVHIL